MWAITALRNSNFTNVEAPLCIHFNHDDYAFCKGYCKYICCLEL